MTCEPEEPRSVAPLRRIGSLETVAVELTGGPPLASVVTIGFLSQKVDLVSSAAEPLTYIPRLAVTMAPPVDGRLTLGYKCLLWARFPRDLTF